MALSHPLISRVRNSVGAGAFLDGVNVAAVGLMAAVTWELGRAALVDWLTGGMALVALAVLVRFAINSAWLVGAGAAVGAVSYLVVR